MINDMLNTALIAGRAAGIHAYKQTGCGNVSYKDALQLVTPADQECQDIIISHIKKIFPDQTWIHKRGLWPFYYG